MVITGNIDLSVGSVAYLSAAVVYLTAGFPPAVSIVLGVATGVAAGLFNGVLVAWLRMNSLLTTLGLMIAYRGISLVLTGGTVRPVNVDLAALGKIKFFGVLPLVFLVSLIVMIVLQIVLSRRNSAPTVMRSATANPRRPRSASRSGSSKPRSS